MKLGALVFVLALSKQFAINLQLLGGVWILQTLPAIVVGLYTRWLHRWALLVGGRWHGYGTWLAYGVPPGQGVALRGPLVVFRVPDDQGLHRGRRVPRQPHRVRRADVVFRAMGVDEGVDQTKDDDYWADRG